MSIKVSVILPSFNVADYIEECLDSAVNQSLRELEIICIDAGSTDGTGEILTSYAEKDSRIVLLRSDKKSYGKQVNMGLDYASGDYVAVLETDDWIGPDMYRCLYEHAETDRLDYAAADFDMFWELQNGDYYFVRQYLFEADRRGWYGRILNTDQLAVLRASDYVLWKGIYNRKFINDNHIRFHESPGAAFQDMGFLQQVKTYAKKAKYLEKSFYKYRQDNRNASSNALQGLQYYEQEFLWINEQLKLNRILKGIHRKYYYYTMSISFITKYEQILLSLDGDWRDKRLYLPYKWFFGQISYAIKCGLIERSMYTGGQWKRLVCLLASQESNARFAMEKEERKRNHTRNIINMINNRPVVIFGCGARGERLMCFCDRNQIHIDSFCDNNTALHDRKKYGFPVISPAQLKDKTDTGDEIILLSMKNGYAEVYEQLTAMGIESNRIISRPLERILETEP